MEKIRTMQAITVAGYTVVLAITFDKFRIDTTSYFLPTSQTTKALKAIFEAAGFKVTRVKTENYSMGNSVNIWIKSELTEEDRAHNTASREAYTPHEFRHEPRIKLIQTISEAFKQGTFDGMTDSYTYNEEVVKVLDPEGKQVGLSTKYVFVMFDN